MGEGPCEILENGIIKTTSKLNKPRDEVYFSVFIKNKGTKAVKIKEVNSDNNVGFDEPNPPHDYVFYHGYIGEVLEDEPWYKGWTGLFGQYILYSLDSEGFVKQVETKYGPTKLEYSTDSQIEESNVIIQPNESIYVFIGHSWGDNYVNPPKEGLTMKYNIQLVFEQVI